MSHAAEQHPIAEPAPEEEDLEMDEAVGDAPSNTNASSDGDGLRVRL